MFLIEDKPRVLTNAWETNLTVKDRHVMSVTHSTQLKGHKDSPYPTSPPTHTHKHTQSELYAPSQKWNYSFNTTLKGKQKWSALPGYTISQSCQPFNRLDFSVIKPGLNCNNWIFSVMQNMRPQHRHTCRHEQVWIESSMHYITVLWCTSGKDFTTHGYLSDIPLSESTSFFHLSTGG